MSEDVVSYIEFVFLISGVKEEVKMGFWNVIKIRRVVLGLDGMFYFELKRFKVEVVSWLIE